MQYAFSRNRLPLWLLSLVLWLPACSDDDETAGEQPPKDTDITVQETISRYSNLSTLSGALETTGLDGVLADGAATYTVFGPDNSAFDNVDVSALDDAALRNVLLNHVLTTRVTREEVSTGSVTTQAALLDGAGNPVPGTNLSIDLSNDAQGVRIGEADILQANLEANNGILHVVDSVLAPNPGMAGLLERVPNADSLLAAVAAVSAAVPAADTSLVEVLNGEGGPYTIFAPTNAAFAAAQDTFNKLTLDQKIQVLSYHVVQGSITASELPADTVTTLSGDSIVVDLSSGVQLRDDNNRAITVTAPDYRITMDIVHQIDSVMLPTLD